MINPLNYLIIVTLLSLCFASCADEDDPQLVDQPITTADDIKALGSYWGYTSSDVSDVLINSQGGPAIELLDDELKTILSSADKKTIEDLFIFNVHQAQTKRPTDFEQQITFEEAKEYNQESVADLAKVINYFKGQGKRVHVLGISFGAFLVQELLNQKGTEIADDYLIMVGRLDMPATIWESFSEGNLGGFENGVTPFSVEVKASTIEKNMNRLAAGLGYKRFTKELADLDLSPVTYVYGELDEKVGTLTQDEIDFLKSKNANLVPIRNAKHSDAIKKGIEKQFDKAFGL